MTDPEHAAPTNTTQIARNLLLLRLALGLFFLQWAVGKLVNPERVLRIFKYFYSYDLDIALVPIMAGLQLALALAFLAGAYRRFTYGAVFLLHLVSVAVTWRQLIDPFDQTTHNHMFIAAVPVLAAFWILYKLRDHDCYSFDAWRDRAKSSAATY